MHSLRIFEDADQLLVEVGIPGLDREKLELQLKDDTLQLSGERRGEDGVAAERCHRRERRTGRFGRTITLPCRVDSGKASADYREGVLRIKLPKAREAQARRIEDYRAVNTTHLRFQGGTGAQSVEVTFTGNYFYRRGEGYDWAWENLLVNGIEWRSKTIPEIPLFEPDPARIAAGKDARSRRAADRRRGVVIGESNTLTSHPVDSRRVEFGGAVAAQVVVALVVDEDEDQVRLAFVGC